MTQRNFESEHRDNAERKYAYDFDNVLRRYMLRTFLPNMLEGETLELGSYRGEFTQLLVDAGAKVTVVEAAGDLVEHLRQRLGAAATLIHSTFEQVELEPKYSNIFLMHTLEHLDDPVGVLQRTRRWLTPNGKLFLVVPNAYAPSRQIAVKMGLISHNNAVTEGERQHGHRATYSFDTLEAEAVAAGLDVIQRGGVFFKALANYQFDRLLGTDIISEAYLDGCYKLGMIYPELCASIYLICQRGAV